MVIPAILRLPKKAEWFVRNGFLLIWITAILIAGVLAGGVGITIGIIYIRVPVTRSLLPFVLTVSGLFLCLVIVVGAYRYSALALFRYKYNTMPQRGTRICELR